MGESNILSILSIIISVALPVFGYALNHLKIKKEESLRKQEIKDLFENQEKRLNKKIEADRNNTLFQVESIDKIELAKYESNLVSGSPAMIAIKKIANDKKERFNKKETKEFVIKQQKKKK